MIIKNHEILSDGSFYNPDRICMWCHNKIPKGKEQTIVCEAKGYKFGDELVLTPYIPLMITNCDDIR